MGTIKEQIKHAVGTDQFLIWAAIGGLAFVGIIVVYNGYGSSNTPPNASSTTVTTQTPAPPSAEPDKPVEPSKPNPVDSPAFKKEFAALLRNLRHIEGVYDVKPLEGDHSMRTINLYVPVGTSKDQAQAAAEPAYHEFVRMRQQFYGESANECFIGVRDESERILAERNWMF